MNTVIPPKQHRNDHRAYAEDRYQLRHLIANAFLLLKRWRGIATRDATNSPSFLAAVQIRCLALWLNIS
ncbi:MAG: Mobile element protein [Nitrospira sp.]|jgi:transposase|nr:Mobile element protein [Nitrospira sp.]MDI3464363.1 Mobile element protein [Nitrospira sp.]